MTRERKRHPEITGVALLAPDGRMISLPAPSRHSHLFALAAFMGVDAEDWRQGFTSNAGVFMPRGHAARLAGLASPEAFSEDFW